MKHNEILKTVNEILIDLLDNPEIVLNDETTAEEVEGWDSLTHIQVVVGIEKHFKIRFTAKEIQGWRKVGEMIECINSKLKPA